MKTNLIAVLLVFAWASTVCCQTVDFDAKIKVKCEKYIQIPLPAEANTIPTPAKFPSCHSLWLYYGFGGEKEDHTAARKCAWQERAVFLKEKNEYEGSPADGGMETLANIYANGVGVTRNIPLALRFACETAEISPAIDQIEALEELAGKPAPRTKRDYFNYCDGDPTTPQVAICASWEDKLEDEERQKVIQQLSATWPQAQQVALTALVKAEFSYSAAHARKEIYLSGSGRVVWEVDAEQGLRNDFVAALQAFEKGQFPDWPAEDSAKADQILNQTYHKIITEAKTSKDEISTIQAEDILSTELVWLKYRDAWIAFAKLRYPKVNSYSWLTLLTNDRTAILKDTACEIGIDEPSCEARGEDNKARPLP
ncbi:MAG: hypothetical protein WAN35_05045 [Terracidiphilus sp.]